MFLSNDSEITMRVKHYNIPIFIPNAGCPHQCVFCSQKRIAGFEKLPSVEEVESIITRNLSTIPEHSMVEIAFFGGNFTGIPEKEQIKYLNTASKYINEKSVIGIRLSTRPDYISRENIALLKHYGATAVELGVQSMDTEVLHLSGRRYKPGEVIKSSELIKNVGIDLGLQMMIGLPGDTLEKTMHTANKIKPT